MIYVCFSKGFNTGSVSIPKNITAAARKLSTTCSALRFKDPITHVYNPLEYAWAAHEQYISQAATGKKKVVFLSLVCPPSWEPPSDADPLLLLLAAAVAAAVAAVVAVAVVAA